MGLVSKRNQGKGQSAGTTVIASGTRFRGELKLEGGLHVDGELEGGIESTSDVSVGVRGSFEGALRAREVVVSGFVNGKIDCDRLEIAPKGKVFGEVTSAEFIIESGGQFVGESHIKGSEPIPIPHHHLDKAGASAEPA